MKIRQSVENRLRTVGGALAIFLMAGSLIALGVLFPKSEAVGDATQDNTAGTWQGTIGSGTTGNPGTDVDFKSASVGVSYNSTFSRTEAGLSVGQTTGLVRSSQIAPPSLTLKKWKKLKFGFVRPGTGSSSVTVDILCGDPAQPDANCPTYDQPIPGFTNIALNASDEYDIPPSLLATKIKLRVNFNRPVVSDAPILLYDWQVFWEVNSGVSLVVSKDRNPANPTLQSGFDANPGVPSNDTVVYSLSYSLDRSVSNLTIELPYPNGCYNPTGPGADREYQATYIGSSGGSTAAIGGAPACSSKNKVVWSLGNKTAGTTGVLTASFRIQSGPPNGIILKSKAKIFGSDYSAVTLPDDSLNIQSKGFIHAVLIAPQYIAKSLTVNYIVKMNTSGYWFQSDLFNAKYEFVYSACMDNSFDPVVTGSGAASVVVDKPSRKITWNLNSPFTYVSPAIIYGVTLKAASSCGTSTVGGTLTVFSEQDNDSSFIKLKTVNATFDNNNLSNWDGSASPPARVSIGKNGGPNPIGAGQKLDYYFRLNNQSTVPVQDFYLIDAIPAQTTFISANFFPRELGTLNVIAKNMKVYYHTCGGAPSCAQPSRGDGGWTEITGASGNYPCSSPCSAPTPSQVRWLKWDVGVGNNFYWDRAGNFDEQFATFSVVTSTSAAGSISNTGTMYPSTACVGSCSSTLIIPIDNKPVFAPSYVPCTTDSNSDGYPENCGVGNPVDVSAGNSYWISGGVANEHVSGIASRGDATNVTVSFRLPNREYLDPVQPVDLSLGATFARCNTSSNSNSTSCPIVAGGAPQSDPSFLYPANNAGASAPAVTCPPGGSGSCTIVWNIPVIYSLFKYPQTYPYRYNFYIKLKPRVGLLNQTTICNGTCELNVTSTPAPANPSYFPYDSPQEVRILANPELKVTKTNLTSNSIPYGGSVQFKITYSNNSNAATADAAVIDAMPFPIDTSDGGTPDISPLPRMIYSSQTAPNGEAVYFITNRSRTGAAPAPNDPAWQPIASVGGQQSVVDWIMWKRNSQFDIGDSKEVTLTVTDLGSPNGTVFQNLAYVSFLNGSSYQTPSTFEFFPALLPENLGSRVTIVNPGFSATSNGNVGSVSGFSFQTKSSSCGSICTTTYMGISGDNTVIDSNFFNSAKNWLLSDYVFASQQTPSIQTANYASMYKDYGKKAVACNSVSECFSGTETIKIYTAAAGNPLNITATNSNYSGVPRILFVDLPSGSDALEINNDFTVASDTALMFVVKGNVKVNYGVTKVEGVYLVDGQFATGRRVNTSSGEAGRFSAISIGRDGFARIVYLAENNVRLITCKDLDCQSKDYGYIATVNASDVQVLKMTLFESSDGKDYPKVVVGLKDSSGKATTKFISCKAENCLDVDPVVNVYDDTQDPDIVINSYYGTPSYLFGTGTTSPRSLSFRNCADADCPNPSPPAPPLAPIVDGGLGTGEDKGNEINYGLDKTPPVFDTVVGTYVDRSPGKNDLWFTRFRWFDSGSCPTDYPATERWWDCRKIVSGNVGYYHGSATHPANGRTFIGYYDTATKEIKYIGCNQADCSTQSVVKLVDCLGGVSCQAVDYKTYVSMETGGISLFMIYTVKNTTTNLYEVKMAYCPSIGICASFWEIRPDATHSISNNPNNPSGPYVAGGNAYSWQQSIAVGRVTEINYPRIVFFDEQGKNLTYARCKTVNCSDINYKQLDRGESIALPDKQLTINGSVIAFGNGVVGGKAIALERDLFVQATLQPGETINLQPKYFYLLRDSIKEPEFITESPP